MLLSAQRISFLSIAFVACGVLTCSGERFDTRPVYLVSHDRTVDADLAHARQSAADGDWDAAQATLLGIQARAPRDPLALEAGVLLARVILARGDVDSAAETVIAVTPGRDAALDLQRDLVLGLVAALRGDTARGVHLLRPLSRRMIDRAQSVEVDCGLAALDANAGPDGAARAITALARVESVSDEGVLWLPTGLPCDQPAARAQAILAVLASVDDPETLAAVLDTLSTGSHLRQAVALRLHTRAVALHQVERWRRWFADLPATQATLMTVPADAGPPVLRVGVLAPVSGPRADIGVEIVREVQLALEETQATDVLIENEGTTTDDVVAAYDRLAAQHAAAIVGPTQEELARALMPRVAAVGVPVYLVAPFADAQAQPGVILAGPAMLARTTRIASLVRSGAAAMVTPVDDAGGEYVARLRGSLTLVGVSLVPPTGNVVVRRVVAGPFGAEARRAIAAQSALTPDHWVYDARAGQPGSTGVWVGLRSGPDFDGHLVRYCDVAGEPPGELGMLAYDAAQRIVASVRGGAPQHVLAPDWEVAAQVTRADGSDALASTRRCPPRIVTEALPDGG